MTTRAHNGHSPDLHALISAGSEIESKYRQVAEILFAAILREPEIFAIEAGKMHPVWWKETQYERAAKAVWNQHTGHSRHYSVDSVCLESGIPVNAAQGNTGVSAGSLYDLMSRHIDTPLQLALEMFIPVYRQWVEHRAAQFTAHGIAQGWEAEQIQSRQAQFREESKAWIGRGEDKNEAIRNWFEIKISGKEQRWPCVPALQSMIEQRFKVAWEPGEYVIAAARPGMGKTHWLLGEIDHFAKSGVRGLFISPDMEKLKIQKRLIGQRSGISPKSDWSWRSEDEKAELRRIMDAVENWPIPIIDDVVNIREIVSLCHAENYRERIEFLAIDYIQLLTDGTNRDENAQLTEISKQLKHLSKVLRIPVIALSQLNRSVEARGGSKRPQLSDLRGSGSIEQDASIIMFFYRPEYYGILENENGESLKGLGEIIFAKQQEDETGTLVCKFHPIKGWQDLNTPDHNPHEQGRTIERDLVDYSEPQSAMKSARPNLDSLDVPF